MSMAYFTRQRRTDLYILYSAELCRCRLTLTDVELQVTRCLSCTFLQDHCASAGGRSGLKDDLRHLLNIIAQHCR